MFASSTKEDSDLEIGLLNEVRHDTNDKPTTLSPHKNGDIELKTFSVTRGEDARHGEHATERREFDDLQIESDERENKRFEEGQRTLMRLKNMEYKRKIRTVFSVIETLKAGAEGIGNKGTGKVKYQPKWTDLHHASARGLVEQIQELVDAGDDPNVIDDRGRTALDVAGIAFYQGIKVENLSEVLKILLAAGGRFNTMKGNIDSLDTPLHTAVELNCVKSIKILLDQGASIACLNSAGLTPLHISIKNKVTDVFKILLTYNCESAEATYQRASTRDISSFTLLQAAVVTEWVQGVQYLLDAGADITSSSNLPYEFYNNVTVEDDSNLIYRLDEIHEPPLHLAAETGNRKILRKLVTYNRNAINQFNQLGQSPLYIAIRSGKLDCVETLINMEADVFKVTNDDQTVLHVAIQFGFMKLAELFELLEADVVNKMLNSLDSLGYAPIHTAVACNQLACIEFLGNKHAFLRLKTNGEFIADWTPLHIAAAKNYPDAADVILKFDRKSIEDIDHKGRSPIHLAASRCNREVMVVMLRNGAVLSSRTKREKTARYKKTKDVTALEMISNELPNPTPFFEEVFDSFIHSYGSDLTNESGCHITMDYGVFTTMNGISQIEILEELVKCKQTKLLLHPLVESLIYLKWRSLLPLFCVIVFIYGLFALSLYGVIIDDFYHENTDTVLKGWFNGIFIAPLILIIIVEIIFITIHRLRYLWQVENWAKMFSILFAIILISTGDASWKDAEWSRHVATIVLLLSWAQIMFLLSRFPYMGFYVLMFCKVSVNILKILITFVFLLFAFSLSFMIQYHSKPPFDGPWSAFIKTVVMMTSEFEYDDLFGKDHSEELANSKEFVHVIFVLFLIFVSIVFVNFMLGVAVSDVNDLKIDGDIRRLEKQVEYLSTLDVLAYGTCMKRILKKDFMDKRFVKEIKIKAGVTKYWKVLYESPRSNDEINDTKNEVSLPSHILDTIFRKIKSKKEQKEEEKRTKLYRTQIDMLFNTIIGNTREIDTLNDGLQTNARTKFDGAMHMLKDLSSLNKEMNNKFDTFKNKYQIADKSTQTDFLISTSMRNSS